MNLPGILLPRALRVRNGALVAATELLRLENRGLTAEAIQLQEAEEAGGHQPEPIQPQMFLSAPSGKQLKTMENHNVMVVKDI